MSGGTGSLVSQIAKLKGFNVIGTSSKPDAASGSYADIIVPYHELEEAVQEATSGEGVASVFDGVGQPPLTRRSQV